MGKDAPHVRHLSGGGGSCDNLCHFDDVAARRVERCRTSDDDYAAERQFVCRFMPFHSAAGGDCHSRFTDDSRNESATVETDVASALSTWPVDERHAAVRVVELTLIFIIQLAMITVCDFVILPSELVARVVLTMLPWFLAGYVAYLFVAAICLEGTRTMKTVLSLVGIAVLFLFYLQPAMEAYNAMILPLIVFIAVLPLLSVGSVIRFKEGLYD